MVCVKNVQLLGYLNVFLWTSDLWFVYKETIWFPGRQNVNSQQNVAGFTANTGGFETSSGVGDDFSGAPIQQQQQQQQYGNVPPYGNPQQGYVSQYPGV